MNHIRDYFIRGDMKGAIEYMKCHEAFSSVLPAYITLFEQRHFRTYDAPEPINKILLPYQEYFHAVFYCGESEATAAATLQTKLRELLGIEDAEEDAMRELLTILIEQQGYHAQFGKSQGYYGPYIWRETVPTTFSVELPGGTETYTVKLLKGFLFRSWMDYLTFGQFGTKGWASPDGTICCIEGSYDFNSESFRISLLKHEAQHVADMRQFPAITPTELEYRAKLIELIYTDTPGLLDQFRSEADDGQPENSHAAASVHIREAFEGCDAANVAAVQERARALFSISNAALGKT